MLKGNNLNYSYIQTMRKVLLLLALFTLNTTIHAQDKTKEELLKELQARPQPDNERVDILTELFHTREFQDNEKTKFAEEALVLSRKINYPVGEAHALLYQVRDADAESNYRVSDSLLHVAEIIVKKANDKNLTAFFLYYKGGHFSRRTNKECIDYFLQAAQAFQQLGDNKNLGFCYYYISEYYLNHVADYPLAMEYILKALNYAQLAKSPYLLCKVWTHIGGIYSSIGDFDNALQNYQKASEANKKLQNKDMERAIQIRIGYIYLMKDEYPEAINAYMLFIKDNSSKLDSCTFESDMANVYIQMDSLPMAFKYGFSSFEKAKELKDPLELSSVLAILARAYNKKEMPDSAIFYARAGLDSSLKKGMLHLVRNNAGALADAYAAKKDFANAYKYHMQFINARDSILNTDLRNRTSMLKYNNDLDKKQTEIVKLEAQRNAQRSFLVSALVVLALILITAGMLFRNNRQKQKANALLTEQKQKVESTLSELKSTQAQLIQSEKMASLGELTAGIAHEIQNPLNFVNNFSEVNSELISELVDELDKGNTEEVKALANDIKENSEKINHHGKRADSIVKGMLQHSRKSKGQKELTDINALCDEYLRLAYHGLRAKDKSFNAELKTDFDPSLPKINVVPQDIGRVILNLINNAFYAVGENRNLTGFQNLLGLVTVQTKKINDKVEISVIDNGNGIPENIVDKIFQPFFTTKPTGQGTGLGLSLSYDIVKAHGGEIKVETKESEGALFIIQLPITI